MERQIIIAGFGGQGVLLTGQLLAYCGMIIGKEVSWMPAYGPEMRGGSANCSVVISDEPIGSPKIEEPDVVIAMNRPSMEQFEPMLVKGGTLIYNTSLIDVAPGRDDIRAVPVDCLAIANEAGNARTANMVMLGAYAAVTGDFGVDTMIESLRHKLGAKKEKMIPVNRLAIEKGMAAVSGN